jgi:hypothetical protein
MSIVIDEIRRRDGQNHVDDIKDEEKRINRNTPAVTSVDECTRALTGVGAAIAAGNQLEKGNCALFVIAASMIITERRLFKSGTHEEVAYQCPWLRDHPIARRRNASPIRLDRTVIIPAPRDFGFW